jgi:hypothetical protein
MPAGDFILKYATGQVWCGDTDLFGPDTTTSRAKATRKNYRFKEAVSAKRYSSTRDGMGRL